MVHMLLTYEATIAAMIKEINMNSMNYKKEPQSKGLIVLKENKA